MCFFGAGFGFALVVVVAGAVPTVKLPFIVDACASQSYLYVPLVSVIVNVCVPTKSMSVATSTPGPARWKL